MPHFFRRMQPNIPRTTHAACLFFSPTCAIPGTPTSTLNMAMRAAVRGVVGRPLVTPQSSARPVLSWAAARWKGSAATPKSESAAAAKKEDAKPKAAEPDKPDPATTPELPVSFLVSGGKEGGKHESRSVACGFTGRGGRRKKASELSVENLRHRRRHTTRSCA